MSAKGMAYIKREVAILDIEAEMAAVRVDMCKQELALARLKLKVARKHARMTRQLLDPATVAEGLRQLLEEPEPGQTRADVEAWARARGLDALLEAHPPTH